MKIYGHINGLGLPELRTEDNQKSEAWFKKHAGKDFVMELKVKSNNRSLNQNDYYWGVIVTMIADEIGDEQDSVHEGLKAKFLMSHDPILPCPRSTADLSTVEFEDYCSKIRVWASSFLGVFIPLPNEVDLYK